MFNRSKVLLTIVSMLSSLNVAHAAATYVVTITNGGSMPISPGALYDSKEASAVDRISQTPSAGFVQLCQTGNPDTKIAELKANKNVNSIVKTDGPILPGESRNVEINVSSANALHFEVMYGKTKDICGVITVDRRALRDVANHVVMNAEGQERVLASGMFADPILPNGNVSEAQALCAQEDNGVKCLRALAPEANGTTRVFTGYLPSLVSFLESQYGTADAQSLIVPTSGAIQLKVALKH